MRAARLIARIVLALITATISTLLPALPSSAGTLPGFSTSPRVADHASTGSSTLVELRAGRHAGFDRVVFQLDGPLPSYSVRYVPVVRLDGSGAALPLRGAAFLEVVVRAPTHDQNGRQVLAPTRLRPDFPALREVNVPGSFEGQTNAGIGVSYRAPFRVLELTDPSRIVVDLEHQAIDDGGVASGPRALTLTPGSGPIGTRVTVEGQGCGSPGAATTRLVFQSGEAGTTGAVDLGEVSTDDQGRFRAVVTIPARLDPLQGIGGGPARPGRYNFTTRPPACAASFAVTSSATSSASDRAATPAASDRAATPAAPRPGSLPFTGSQTPLLLAMGGSLLLAGTGLVLLVRRHRRLAS